MQTLVLIIHVIACLALIAIVLLQTGRGAEMGAAFGGSSQTLFGSSGGSTFLGKLTTAAAVVFMITCLGLTYMFSGPSTKSVMEKAPIEKPQGPALPEATPVPTAPGQSAESASQGAPAETKLPPAQPAPEAGKAETPPAAEGNKPASPGAKQ
ncbi:MAG TPA: preprotein translocase subunit SecG [Syntrophobacteraceae bacterium]|nr:preprotein translocase subunit SecG [Syntrophobacteraceae bacterium]